MAPEDPVVNAMLVCDHVHRDPTTGKHALGVFDNLRLPSFPAELSAFAAYLNLTNLNGAYSVELSGLRADTEVELARLSRSRRVTVRDPLARSEVRLRVPSGLPVPSPGRYILRLYMNRRYIQDFAMIVEQ